MVGLDYVPIPVRVASPILAPLNGWLVAHRGGSRISGQLGRPLSQAAKGRFSRAAISPLLHRPGWPAKKPQWNTVNIGRNSVCG